MALIWLDSCDEIGGWFNGLGSLVAGRNGNGVQMGSPTITIPAAQEADCITIGFAIKVPAYVAASNLVLLKSDAAATTHVVLQISTTGQLTVLRNSVVLLGPTAAGIIVANRWHYVELATRLHDTLGSAVLRVDGTTVLTGSSLDTKNAGTKAVFDSVTFTSTTPFIVDDLYLCTATTTPDAFLGDVVVEQLLPNANGTTNQWVGSDMDSTDNYLNVDEPATSTADWNGDSVVGHQDLYNLPSVTRTGVPIKAICHSAYLSKSDAVNARSAKLVNRRTVDNKGVTHVLSATGYSMYGYGLLTDPETSAAWTETNVNAVQSGVEVA